jgi:hypothetical protein
VGFGASLGRSDAPATDASALSPQGAYADLAGFSFAVYLQDGLGPRLHLPDKLARKMRGRVPQRMDLLMKGCSVP